MITDKDMYKAHIAVRMVTNEIHGFLYQKIGIKETEEKIANMFYESAEQARKEERMITLEEVRSICLIETSITTDDIDRLIEQAKSKETKQ